MTYLSHILTGSLDPDNTKWWVGFHILPNWFFLILTLKNQRVTH